MIPTAILWLSASAIFGEPFVERAVANDKYEWIQVSLDSIHWGDLIWTIRIK